jgi:hypothetical protein
MPNFGSIAAILCQIQVGRHRPPYPSAKAKPWDPKRWHLLIPNVINQGRMNWLP